MFIFLYIVLYTALRTMKPELLDPTRRIPSELFATLCVPFRILLGFILITTEPSTVTTLLHNSPLIVAVPAAAAMGIGYKAYINPHSWKHYYRSIATLLTIFTLFVYAANVPSTVSRVQIASGLLVIVDALMGKQMHYVASIMT